MKNHDSDLIDWWNRLPEDTRAFLFKLLGLESGPTKAETIEDIERLEMALRLFESDTPPGRPN